MEPQVSTVTRIDRSGGRFVLQVIRRTDPAQLRCLHAVAASLRPSAAPPREGPGKHEPDALAGASGSTAPDQDASDRRAARAQCGIDG